MKDIRKGNDITIHWAIYTKSGSQRIPYALEGKDLTLILGSPYMRKEVKGFSVKGNIITWTYFGKDQKSAGKFSLVLIENEGKEGMHTVDKCNAFRIVNLSCEVGGSDESDVETVTLEFESTIDMGDSAGTSVDLSAYLATFPQEFSEEQKSQARENIGAESEAYVTDFTIEDIEYIYRGNASGSSINISLPDLLSAIHEGRGIKIPMGYSKSGTVDASGITEEDGTFIQIMTNNINGSAYTVSIYTSEEGTIMSIDVGASVNFFESTESGPYIDDNLGVGGTIRSGSGIETTAIGVRDFENATTDYGESGQVLMADGEGGVKWENINTQTSSVVVDSELSETSTNPVQNAVITQNFAGVTQVFTWLDDAIKQRPTDEEVDDKIGRAQLGGVESRFVTLPSTESTFTLETANTYYIDKSGTLTFNLPTLVGGQVRLLVAGRYNDPIVSFGNTNIKWANGVEPEFKANKVTDMSFIVISKGINTLYILGEWKSYECPTPSVEINE